MLAAEVGEDSVHRAPAHLVPNHFDGVRRSVWGEQGVVGQVVGEQRVVVAARLGAQHVGRIGAAAGRAAGRRPRPLGRPGRPVRY